MVAEAADWAVTGGCEADTKGVLQIRAAILTWPAHRAALRVAGLRFYSGIVIREGSQSFYKLRQTIRALTQPVTIMVGFPGAFSPPLLSSHRLEHP
ncbi:MAG: hypothetical protein BWK72_09775 [Rhodoferax ferrireducens]|uniref:Uncharacterized protein n=1 Tax=Rhodoferax ferrireducens TaxID=192843 RepID=A0A1W9KU41_9BURK|nr:MAG: hypothetical protein BWK72_09775 [Rhodoferax ferrireducens]